MLTTTGEAPLQDPELCDITVGDEVEIYPKGDSTSGPAHLPFNTPSKGMLQIIGPVIQEPIV